MSSPPPSLDISSLTSTRGIACVFVTDPEKEGQLVTSRTSASVAQPQHDDVEPKKIGSRVGVGALKSRVVFRIEKLAKKDTKFCFCEQLSGFFFEKKHFFTSIMKPEVLYTSFK